MMNRGYYIENDICRAGRTGKLNLVKFLLEAGASLDSCDDNSDSLLVCLLSWKCAFSKREKKRQFIKVLINMGACVNTVNFQGNWTLHMAVKGCVQGFVAKRTIKRLVAAGSLIHLQNDQGLLARDIAFDGGLGDIGEFLLFREFERHQPQRSRYVAPSAPYLENHFDSSPTTYLQDDCANDIHYSNVIYKDEEPSPQGFLYNDSSLQYPNSSLMPHEMAEEEIYRDLDTECNICMEEYKLNIQIFSCFRCRKSLCEDCKKNNVIDTCPFCRADNSKVQYRNMVLERKISQSREKRRKMMHME